MPYSAGMIVVRICGESTAPTCIYQHWRFWNFQFGGHGFRL